METTQTNVFEDIPQYHQPASTGLRLANYLIDMILFYGFFFGCMFLFGVLLQVSTDSVDEAAAYLDTVPGKLLSYLAAFSLLVIFFTLMEGITKGRSLGKLITGTVAMREDGLHLTWKDALIRSLCRVIPFEVFSGLSGHPWHDSMSKTMVIKK